jgi:hypothetical protein
MLLLSEQESSSIIPPDSSNLQEFKNSLDNATRIQTIKISALHDEIGSSLALDTSSSIQATKDFPI